MTPLAPFSSVWDRVRAWPVESQLGARRNAMVASTALAARRAERQEVDAFFAAFFDDRTDAPELPAVGRR